MARKCNRCSCYYFCLLAAMLLMAEILKYTVLVLPRIEQLSTRLGQNLKNSDNET